jgi:hypothetical protein
MREAGVATLSKGYQWAVAPSDKTPSRANFKTRARKVRKLFPFFVLFPFSFTFLSSYCYSRPSQLIPLLHYYGKDTKEKGFHLWR